MLPLMLILATTCGTPYGNNYAPHAVATTTMGVFFLMAEGWAKPALPVSYRAVQWPDTTAERFRSEAWRRTSDMVALGTIALSVGTSAPIGTGRNVGSVATAALVTSESVLTAAVFSELVKYAFRRPRPLLYQTGRMADLDTHLSFPSMHTAGTAAAVTALASTWGYAHPGSPITPVIAAAGGLATAVVATGRVLGGEHFISDVVAGCAIGVAAGYLVPLASKEQQHGAPGEQMVGFGVPM